MRTCLRSQSGIAACCVALLATLGAVRIADAQTKFLVQNWNPLERQTFYTTTQGSRMLPYEWFMALEVAEGSQLFARTRLAELGYLPNNDALNNPDRLPVGFVVDTDYAGRKFLGLTCAACHTNQIRYQGHVFQIDGAPTLADMGGLLSGLRDALNATVGDDAKFTRFATRVLGRNSSPQQLAELKQEVTDFQKRWKGFVHDSQPDPTGKLTWGRARLDAFGMIFNRVSSIDLDEPSNSAAPNAPVSYPFLWGTSWEDRVQWNASAPNRNDIERLGRNVGEVLGVFGDADLQRASILRPYYRTSAKRLNQVLLENLLKKLWSPKWPDAFPAIDEAKRSAGEVLYRKHCLSCHEVIAHGKQDTPVKIVATPVGKVGTDPVMALNAIQRQAKTGRLIGSKLPPGFQPLPATMPTGALLVHVVHGAVISPFHDVESRLFRLGSLKSRLFDLQPRDLELAHDDILEFIKRANLRDEDDLQQRIEDYAKYAANYQSQLREFVGKLKNVAADKVEMADNPFVYKARPLDGIWATAPYLHNGSVPNLRELLLPVAERSKKFHVGNPEFDPARVGFVTTAGPNTTEIDTSLPGNSNRGHDQYGNQEFKEDEVQALLEYLKSL